MTSKLIENEARFREINEEVERGLEKLEKTAADEGWSNEVKKPTEPFHFYCECSDEDCRLRVRLSLDDYVRIHKNRTHFVVRCGHEEPRVESVIEHGDEFCIVEKISRPPESVDSLQPTDADNV